MKEEERVVIGCKGKIGKAIYEIFDAHIGIDIKENEYIDLQSDPDKYRIIHFCIPYTDDFIKIVKEYVEMLKPQLLLIHTTLPVGTTRKLYELLCTNIAHVPFHGKHTDGKYSPINIVTEPFRYIMAVGSCTFDTGCLICDYVNRFGFHSELFSPETTEFAKLMATNLLLDVIRSWEKYYQKKKKNNYICWNGVTTIIKDIAVHEPNGYLNRCFQHIGTIDSEISGKHCLTDNEGLL